MIGLRSKAQFQKEIKMKLSNQAVGAVMMALQKSLMEQSDIVPVLREFNLKVDESGEVVVTNPPSIKADTPTKVVTS